MSQRSEGQAATSASTTPASPATKLLVRHWSLRAQFTFVIFLLAFLPNLAVTLLSTRMHPTLLLWLTLVGVFSALIGYFLSGMLLGPLSRLEREVRSGDFTHQHHDDPAEILALRKAFVGLVGRLNQEQGRRNAFMATLVHDLKTPLIATSHLTQVLTEMPLPDTERREIGRNIQAETSRLLELVQQMADAHRFERDQIQLHLRTTELRPLLEQVAQRLTPRAQERGLNLLVTGEGRARVDRATLERAVTNLAENALRYSKGHLLLAVGPQGIVVADDGPGLRAPLSELAEPFNAQPTTIAGQQYTAGTAGLGLFIVRRIAEAHGGHLLYEKRPLEQDIPNLPSEPFSLFTISLPEVTV